MSAVVEQSVLEYEGKNANEGRCEYCFFLTCLLVCGKKKGNLLAGFV